MGSERNVAVITGASQGIGAALVKAYRDALEPCNGWPPSMPELMEAVDYCHLHLSVQLLGWSSDWSPPEKHYQNWLGEAFRLAGSLGL